MNIKQILLTLLICTSILPTGKLVMDYADPEERLPIIIMFKEKPDVDLIKVHGGQIKHIFSLIPAIVAILPSKSLARIRNEKGVLYVEEDQQVRALAQTMPWGVDRIDADVVHSFPKRGSGVHVAILDSGIDYLHPDLASAYYGGYDFVNDDSDPRDDEGHGTHVAGIIAAEDNNIGVIGVAPEAHLFALKVLNKHGTGLVSDVIAGMEWSVNNGMQIISMSLGSDSYSAALEQACDSAYSAGLILVAAAGNDGDTDPDNDVDYPARYASVIAVASTDSTDTRAPSSSDGPEVELAAPGVSILSTYVVGNNHVYAYASGTSMACPHVAGVAALVIASPADPNYDTDGDGVWDNNEVRMKIQDTAEDLGPTGRDNEYGYGLVDAGFACAKLQTTLAVDTAPRIINKLGTANTTISGYLTTYGTGVEGASINLQYAITSSEYGAPSGGAWNILATVQTSTDGLHEYAWDPSDSIDDGFYCVRAEFGEDANYTSSSSQTGTESIPNLQIISEYYLDVNISDGWNLIGVPFNLREQSIESVFAGNLTYVDAVYGYENGVWSYWFPVSSTLTEFECGRGYWVLANADFTVTLTGSLGDAPLLVDGWNLLAVNVTDPVSTVEYLTGTNWSIVYGYDAETETWSYYINGVGGPLDTLRPGEGYWVLVETI